MAVAALVAAGCGGKGQGAGGSGSGSESASSTGGGAGGSTSSGSGGGSSSGGSTGDLDGGRDAGVDAGCTPGDGGDCPFCGAGNFVVECPGLKGLAGTCPRNATCNANQTCSCNAGYAEVSCDGGACSGNNCTSPGWWCAPVAPGGCGPLNFTVTCPRADGGSFTCPTHAICGSATCAGCEDGFVDESCDGISCQAMACAASDWWCAPREAGACGPQNFTLACPDGDGGILGYCPTNGICQGRSCGCLSGYVQASCSNQPCAIGGCPEDEYWCAPAGGCGALNFTVPCPSGGYCPANSRCVGGSCQCEPGFAMTDCAGVPCQSVDGGCSYPNWWCTAG